VTKKELRKHFLTLRKSLQDDYRFWASKKISESFFLLEAYLKAKTILFYMPFNFEVDITFLIKEALKDKIVVLPKINKKTTSLLLFKVCPDDFEAYKGFVKNSYGILEPKDDKEQVAVTCLDLVIVPGVAFDFCGYRLGYGKGYYDRLLAGKKVRTIGVAYSCQVTENVLATEYDLKVDILVTEKDILFF